MTVTADGALAPTPPAAIELGLETARACRIAAIPDAGVRRAAAARALADRRADLALMRVLLVEAYGTAKSIARLEADDPVLLELTVLAVA